MSFRRLTNGTRTSDAKCVKVLISSCCWEGQLGSSPIRSSLCAFLEPDRTQFPHLILPVNSQLTTLRAPDVSRNSLVNSQRHSFVPAVSCLCHGLQANETTNKCWFENWALLGYYAKCSVSSLQTFRHNISVPTSRVKNPSWPLKMGSIGCPETSVRSHHYTLRNIPEKHIYFAA
jgi:hypothetical protein